MTLEVELSAPVDFLLSYYYCSILSSQLLMKKKKNSVSGLFSTKHNFVTEKLIKLKSYELQRIKGRLKVFSILAA